MVTANRKRVVVLTGVTGVDVGSIADYAKRQFNVETMKFEEFVEEEFNAPVYHAIELLLINRKSAIEKFIKAFNKMVEAVKSVESTANTIDDAAKAMQSFIEKMAEIKNLSEKNKKSIVYSEETIKEISLLADEVLKHIGQFKV